jgi:hypothetical protein
MGGIPVEKTPLRIPRQSGFSIGLKPHSTPFLFNREEKYDPANDVRRHVGTDRAG